MWDYLYYRIYMISSATAYDNVMINAGVRALYSDRYKCDKFREDIQVRINKSKKEAHKKGLRDNIIAHEIRNSCGRVSKSIKDTIGNIEYYTCLCKLKHPLFNEIYYVNKACKNGIMPFIGGYLEQPAQIIELIELYDSATIREEGIIAEQRKKKNG